VALFGGAAGARAAFVAMALLPGRPLLYNGQEVESPQTLRLFYRDPIAWEQAGAEQARGFYRRVVELARTDSAFLSATFREVETSAPDAVIAFQRGDAIELVNARPREAQVGITGFEVEGAHDLLSNRVQRGNTVILRGTVLWSWSGDQRAAKERALPFGVGEGYRRMRSRTKLSAGRNGRGKGLIVSKTAVRALRARRRADHRAGSPARSARGSTLVAALSETERPLRYRGWRPRAPPGRRRGGGRRRLTGCSL
jgi:hypothetical protein